MRTIIAGSRTIWDNREVEKAIKLSGFHITKIISGGARGPDKFGEQYACKHGIPCTSVLAQWSKYGKLAGIIRNEEMAKIADALIALWDGVSLGTEHMIKEAERMNLKVYVHKVTVMHEHHNPGRADYLKIRKGEV